MFNERTDTEIKDAYIIIYVASDCDVTEVICAGTCVLGGLCDGLADCQSWDDESSDSCSSNDTTYQAQAIVRTQTDPTHNSKCNLQKRLFRLLT